MPAIKSLPIIEANPSLGRVRAFLDTLRTSYVSSKQISFTSLYGDGLALLNELSDFLSQIRRNTAIVMTKPDLELLLSLPLNDKTYDSLLFGNMPLTESEKKQLFQIQCDLLDFVADIHDQLISNSMLLDDQLELWKSAKASDEI